MNTNEEAEAARLEHGKMVSAGKTFSLVHTIRKRQKGFLGYLSKRIPVQETLTFKIEEPTLATLDRLATEQLALEIDDSLLASESGMVEARKLLNAQAQRCAKIVALAVLGSEYEVATETISGIKYVTNEKKLKELTGLFFKNVEPSKLSNLVILVDVMSNLGDFCNSIRMMSACRTTKPQGQE